MIPFTTRGLNAAATRDPDIGSRWRLYMIRDGFSMAVPAGPAFVGSGVNAGNRQELRGLKARASDQRPVDVLDRQ
jgi:hypothetical protein